MPKAILVGLVAGLIFGLVVVWQGAGAAGVVLLFTLLGLLVGLAVWLGWRAYTGQIDAESVKSLIVTIFSNRTRQ